MPSALECETTSGEMELLAIDLGHSESDRSWGKFVSDLKARGLKDPLLTCSDGNAAVINAIDANFTTGYRQRCLKHRTENILDAVPKDEQKPVADLLHNIFYGSTSLELAGIDQRLQCLFRSLVFILNV